MTSKSAMYVLATRNDMKFANEPPTGLFVSSQAVRFYFNEILGCRQDSYKF